MNSFPDKTIEFPLDAYGKHEDDPRSPYYIRLSRINTIYCDICGEPVAYNYEHDPDGDITIWIKHSCLSSDQEQNNGGENE